MKKSFSTRIICMILAISMLFANISFVFADGESTWDSSRDSEVINKLLDLAVYGSFDQNITGHYWTTPVIYITNDMIEKVKLETGYDGNIYIRQGRIYMIEGEDGYSVEKDGVKLDKGVSEDTLRTYTFQLGSNSENYLAADGKDNNINIDYDEQTMAINKEEALNAYNDKIKESIEDKDSSIYTTIEDKDSIYTISFVGAIVSDATSDDDEVVWNDSVSFSTTGSGGIVSIRNADEETIIERSLVVNEEGNVVQGEFSSNVATIEEINEVGDKASFNVPKSFSKTQNRKYSFYPSKTGIYAIGLVDKAGTSINMFNIYKDGSGSDWVAVSAGTDDIMVAVLREGEKYEIDLPDGGEYTVNIEYIGSLTDDSTNDIELAEAAAKEYYSTHERGEAEWYEKILAFFILAAGEGLKWIISVIVPDGSSLSIDAIIFDRYPSTTLTLFNADNKYYANAEKSFVNPLFEKDAGAARGLNEVYGKFQQIALIVYVVILVYMGIRVLLISTADKKAKYKQLLMDWIKGVAILFLFPYVIRYAILLNHGIVTYIYENSQGVIKGNSPGINSEHGQDLGKQPEVDTTSNSNYMDKMHKDAWSELRISYAICWFVMLIQMIQFLVVYMMRLVKVVFLIAIFPLITISYAIDKIGDGKSQAFDHWCKEFLLEVFVQTFHAVNYVVVMGLVFSLLDSNWFLAIIGITYVSKGSDMIRGLFAQMKGGGAGGPMNPAKSLIKAKAIMGGIKAIGGVAKGITSPIGKGMGVAGQGYQKILDAKLAHSENNLAKHNRATGKSKTITELTQQAPHITIKLNQGEIQTLIKQTDEPNANYAEIAAKFASLENPEKDLNDALNAMNLSDEEKEKLRNRVQNITNAGTAGLILTAHRRRSTNVEIQQTVDVCMKNMSNPDFAKTLQGFGLGDKKALSDIAAQHSITLNDKKRNERLARESSLTPPSTSAEMIKYRANALKNANEGESNLEELNEYTKYLEDIHANGTDEEKQLVDDEFKDSNFSLEQFKANLAVQTINHSDTIESENRQAYVDASIATVKSNAEAKDKRFDAILSGLETTVEVQDLKEGYIPIVKHRNYAKEERQALMEEIANRVENGEVDFGEESEVLNDQYAKESLREGIFDLALGGVQTAAGVATGVARAAVTTSTAIMSTGVAASADTKGGNPFANIAVIVPETMAATDKIASTVVDAAGYVPGTVGKALLGGHKKSRNINQAAHEENMQQIKNEQELKYSNDVIDKKQAQLETLTKRLKKINGNKNE